MVPRSLLTLACAGGLLAACSAPPTSPDGFLPGFAGSLGNGGPANVQLLAGAQSDLTVALSPQRPALLALSTHQERSADVRMVFSVDGGLSPVATAPQLGGPGQFGGPGPGPGRPRGFEARLRGWDRALTLRHGYQLASANEEKVGDTAKFWVIATADDRGDPVDRQVDGRVIYAGEHCVVMLDGRSGSKEESRGLEMGQAFDRQIYQTDTQLFGEPAGPAAGKTTLLITQEVGNHGRDTTIGYFTVRDLVPPSAEGGDAHGNSRAMLYISSSVVSRGRPADYLGTLAHEFQHLINASRKLQGTTPHQEDVWLDEGLAMYAMQANGYGLGAEAGVLFDHVQAYLRSPDQYSLTDWDNDPDGSAYGAVYLFVTYLADRFGADMLKELVSAGEVGTANVQARLATRGANLADVFQDWVGANLIDGTGMSSDPRYDYKSIDLTGSYGRKRLRGVSVSPLRAPNAGHLAMLPYSATYLLLQGQQDATYHLNLGGADVQGFLITPR
ncbi:MAG: hypothetical protein JWM80_6668 [Cyanobacteria bacterium RYN_339]|nr:hypothetical protein [Cyanobacteria bacterium RYN_339]